MNTFPVRKEQFVDDLDTRRERAARNQSLFREVNERIAELSRRFLVELQPITYVCECLDEGCSSTLQLAPDEYDRLREHGNQFFVLPGHEDAAVETVVESTDLYLIVEKIGVGADVANSLNTRLNGAS